MPSIELSVKTQFAKVFHPSDWELFKEVAEANLKEAAGLHTKDMQIEDRLKLLARNSRKRLLIGIGVELLLKSVYLKHGFLINRAPKDANLTFPFTSKAATNVDLNPDQTYMMNDLVEKLPRAISLKRKTLTLTGLRIAKVFRNKEGHVVTRHHSFDPTNYHDIANALSALYEDAFGEKLKVQFSMAPNEPCAWEILDVENHN